MVKSSLCYLYIKGTKKETYITNKANKLYFLHKTNGFIHLGTGKLFTVLTFLISTLSKK